MSTVMTIDDIVDDELDNYLQNDYSNNSVNHCRKGLKKSCDRDPSYQAYFVNEYDY